MLVLCRELLIDGVWLRSPRVALFLRNAESGKTRLRRVSEGVNKEEEMKGEGERHFLS
jgi:hypothetical protein